MPCPTEGLLIITPEPAVWDLRRHAQRCAVTCEYVAGMSEIYEDGVSTVEVLCGYLYESICEIIDYYEAVKIAVILDVTPCILVDKYR
jgi:hypothetical protein